MPGTRSMMIRSTPALSVIIDTGHVPHAPTSETCTTASSSMPLKTMSPPSLWSAGRIASIASRTPSSMLATSSAIRSPNRRTHAAQPVQYRACSPTPSTRAVSSPSVVESLDVGAQGLQTTGEVGIAALDVLTVVHDRLAVGHQTREHERGARPDVGGTHGSSRQPL